MKWVKIAAVLVVLGVGGYFGFGWLMENREKLNAKTDPGRHDKSNGPAGIPPGESGSGTGKPMRGSAEGGDDPATKPPEKELPVIPAVWTLDLGTAKIPEGQANGMISGTNFVVQTARLDIVGTAHVLSLRQGTGASPDREILIYLHPNPGEALAGQTLSVSQDMKGSHVPKVAKRWKTNPKYAPQQKNYANGYAMKLELGTNSNAEISGKIFLALPDAERSVVAGVFKVANSLPATGNPSIPATPSPAAASDPAFEKRYGIKR